MKKLAIHFLIVHTATLFVAGFGVWYLLLRFFPETLISTYFLIPIFFYLAGLVFIFIMMKIPKDNPKEMVNTYMLLRVVKVFAGVIMITFYWFLDKGNVRNFAIIFIIFYLLYLGVETYIYSRMETYLKIREKKKSTITKKKLDDTR